MHEFQKTPSALPPSVMKEDLYGPVLGLFVGGTIATVGLVATANRLRKGEGLKVRDSIGAVGGLMVLNSFKQADKIAEQMMYQEMSQGYMQD